ncbi:MAG: hypothetical protein SGILL_006363, partial [Bacillariaceae sp.]
MASSPRQHANAKDVVEKRSSKSTDRNGSADRVFERKLKSSKTESEEVDDESSADVGGPSENTRNSDKTYFDAASLKVSPTFSPVSRPSSMPTLPPTQLPTPPPSRMTLSPSTEIPILNESTAAGDATTADDSSQPRKSAKSDDGNAGPKSSGKSGKKSGSDDDQTLPLCVVDDRGFAISKNDPRFEEGTLISSSFTVFEADNTLSDILAGISTYQAIGAAVLGGTAAAISIACPPCAVVLGVAAALASLGSIIFGLISAAVAEFSDAEILILNKLNQIIDEFQVVRRITAQLFATLRRDIGDQTLDEISNVLDRISSSYMDYIKAAQLNSTTFEGDHDELLRIQDSYREQFRISCNELQYTPRDIIRILNGHACGDVNKYPERCHTGDGRNTGACLFGSKQRSYLFDKFRLGEGSSAALVTEFKFFLASNLLEAFLLQSVCLPPDEYGCPSENDPIFAESIQDSFNAINETLTLITVAEQECICPCKKIMFSSVDLSDLDDAGGSEAEGWINLGVQVPGSEDKNLRLATRFDGSRLFEDIAYTYPEIVTEADIIHVQLVEDDDFFSGGGDDIFNG